MVAVSSNEFALSGLKNDLFFPQDAQPYHLLAGHGQGKLPDAGGKDMFPPGIEIAGIAEPAFPQLPDDAAAAVFILEAAAAVLFQGKAGIAAVGGVLLVRWRYLPHRAANSGCFCPL